uniref:Uncharacterized protein n=1 Tax=Strombidinopsis acuminata TaxID=141414 RepID=A0A7S3TSU6_9SPIT|mmetsp:Transcript_36381/g.93804  ORF Transcript_36381/g.93804 Transcript_36381/m.93804 type:complete len:207 (-) Transcript_36381:173-793(-)
MPWNLDDLEDDEEFAPLDPEEEARLGKLTPHGTPQGIKPTHRDLLPVDGCWEEASPRSTTAIIFLDVDGVLHPVDAPQEDFLHSKHLEELRRVVDASGARIVLSSTWRLDAGHAYQLSNAIAGMGLQRPIGATPDYWQQGRAAEISAWLATNAALVDGGRWLAIDDLPLTPDLPEAHVITTDGNVGLTKELADAAIAKLQTQDVCF